MPHHPNESVAKMAAELLREAGLLVCVFVIIEFQAFAWWQIVLFEVLGGALMWIGVKIERSRTE